MKSNLPTTSPGAGNSSVSSTIPQSPSEFETSASSSGRESYEPPQMNTPTVEHRRRSELNDGAEIIKKMGVSCNTLNVIFNQAPSETTLGNKSSSALSAPVGGTHGDINVDRSTLSMDPAVNSGINATESNSATSQNGRSTAPVPQGCLTPASSQPPENFTTENPPQPTLEHAAMQDQRPPTLDGMISQTTVETLSEEATRPKELYEESEAIHGHTVDTVATSCQDEQPCTNRTEEETQPKLLFNGNTDVTPSATNRTPSTQEEQPCTIQSLDQPTSVKTAEKKKRKAKEKSTPSNKKAKKEIPQLTKMDVFKRKARARALMGQSNYAEAYSVLQQLHDFYRPIKNAEVEGLIAECAAMSGVIGVKEAVGNFDKALRTELNPKLDDLEELFKVHSHSQNKAYVNAVIYGSFITPKLPEEKALKKTPEYIQNIVKMKIPTVPKIPAARSKKGPGQQKQKKQWSILKKFTLPTLESMLNSVHAKEGEQNKEEKVLAHATCQMHIANLEEANGLGDNALKRIEKAKTALENEFGENSVKKIVFGRLELCEAKNQEEKSKAKKLLKQAKNHVNESDCDEIDLKKKVLAEIKKMKDNLGK